MTPLELSDTSVDQAELEVAAAALAQRLKRGDVVFLQGPLGAGKTTFVRGVLAGRGGDPMDASSPTYALVHVYDTPHGPLVHADLYRLAAAAEVLGLELDEWAQEGVVMIEWPERGQELLPPPTWIVSLATEADPERRRLRVVRAKC